MSILRASPRATAMGTDGPIQTVVRRVVAVTWVCSDVVRADDAFTLEGRSKHGRFRGIGKRSNFSRGTPDNVYSM